MRPPPLALGRHGVGVNGDEEIRSFPIDEGNALVEVHQRVGLPREQDARAKLLFQGPASLQRDAQSKLLLAKARGSNRAFQSTAVPGVQDNSRTLTRPTAPRQRPGNEDD